MAEPDIYATCMLMAQWSKDHVEKLKPFAARYQEERNKEPDRLRDALFQGPRSGGIGLLRDLTDLWLAASEVHCSYECLIQAAKALRDTELLESCASFQRDADRQLAWLRTRIDQAAPQALTVV
jgi:ferredoxin-nitrate reductase